MATTPSPGKSFKAHPNLGGSLEYGGESLIPVDVGSISATTSFSAFSTSGSRYDVLGFSIVDQSGFAAHGSNYWKFDLQDAGAAGSGTTSLFKSIPSTEAILTGKVPRDHSCDQNNKGLKYGLQLVVTKVGSPSALASAKVFVRVRHKL